MILPIVPYGSPVLRKTSEPIDKSYPNLKELIANMYETMYGADGVGLAAPQIDLPIRLVVIGFRPYDEKTETYGEPQEEHTLINPVILESGSEKDYFNEGCLSIPDIHEDVLRPTTIRLRWLDENFNEHDEWFEGFPARVLQHEIDHLDGKCFIDRMSPLRRQMNKKALSSIASGKFSCDYKVKVPRK